MPSAALAQACDPCGNDIILTVVAGPAVANRSANTPLDQFVCRDSQRLGIGDLGPGFILFAPRTGGRPSAEEFARMVWGVYFLRPL